MSYEQNPQQTSPQQPYYQPQQGPGQVPYGQPVPETSDDRTWAMVSHLGSFLAAWIALGILCPILVLVAKSRSAFVRHHAYESLNFQLNALVIAVVGGGLGFVIGVVTLGLAWILLAPIALAYIVFYCAVVIQASLAANRGEPYRYPLTVRFFNP